MRALADAEVVPIGRMRSASNAVYQCLLREAGESDGGAPDDIDPAVLCVYKPAAGERPLWDFPGSVLARHEVAAFTVSEALGWGLVPETIWRDDLPMGPGVLQRWVAADVGDDVELFERGQVPPGWLGVIGGEDERGRDVVLAHADSERLADLALFDVAINNADRKAGHLLGNGSAVMGIDHGVAFHHEWKVRTVLWGFAGRPIGERREAALRGLAEAVADGLPLDGIGQTARTALLERVAGLLRAGVYPAPRPGWPVVPWPLW